MVPVVTPSHMHFRGLQHLAVSPSAIYPVNVAQPQTLEVMLRTCAVARKYQMFSALPLFQANYIRVTLVRVVTNKIALRTYTLAFNEGLKEVLNALLWAMSSPAAED